MKHLYTFTLLSVAALAGLTSCSSSKNAQNSPDMYSSGNSKGSGSDYVAAAPNDQYVQMKVQDPDRWSYFDDYNAYDSYNAPAPYYGAGYGMGYGMGYGGFSPYYGMGYSPFFGPSFGMGLGFGDPYMLWNNYFIWNSWYNPYFYNPYYGAPVIVAGKGPGSVYSNLRPFNTTAYGNGLAHAGVTSSGRNVVYRPGMSATTAYNSHVSSNRTTNVYRPVNNAGNFRSYSQPTRSYSPSFNTGGGMRSGGFSGGGRH
jgi:hypothetical protein